MLLVFILAIYVPGHFDPVTTNTSLMQLLKDTALMAGVLLIAASGDEPHPKSI
jgi:hypothetical protein